MELLYWNNVSICANKDLIIINTNYELLQTNMIVYINLINNYV